MVIIILAVMLGLHLGGIWILVIPAFVGLAMDIAVAHNDDRA